MLSLHAFITKDDMKTIQHHILHTLSLVLIATTLLSCDKDLPEPEEGPKDHTVIVYMGAENSLSPYSLDDLYEMRNATQDIPENSQVVVYNDANAKPTILHLTKDCCVTWREYGEELNSGDASVMEEVLGDIISNFPSERYSLVLWSHGSGWIKAKRSPQRSIILDNGQNSMGDFGSWVEIDELAKILSALPRMEYIFFDACYMQSVEVAAELYEHTPYIIASPTEIPGNGAPYHLIMEALCKADIQGIIDGYASGYQGTYGVLLSAVYSAKYPDLCTETAKHIPQIFSKEEMPSIAGVQIYAPRYGSTAPNQDDVPVPYDLRSAMHRMLSAEDYTAWEFFWREAILYPRQAKEWASKYTNNYYGPFHRSMQDPDHYGGISMNIPDEKYDNKGWNSDFQQTKWYKLTSWEQTGW